MSNLQIFVFLSGIVMTILTAWYFWFAPKAQTRVAISASGEFGFQCQMGMLRGKLIVE